MTEEEAKEEIGENNWEDFNKWMVGQTCGLNPDGSTNYYKCDVETFKRKIKTGQDRQNSALWD